MIKIIKCLIALILAPIVILFLIGWNMGEWFNDEEISTGPYLEYWERITRL